MKRDFSCLEINTKFLKKFPCLATLGDWCCTPNSLGVGIYEAYLLGGLRLLLKAFARELLHRLGIGPNQLNPNAWRTIVSM